MQEKNFKMRKLNQTYFNSLVSDNTADISSTNKNIKYRKSQCKLNFIFNFPFALSDLYLQVVARHASLQDVKAKIIAADI